MTYRNFLFTFGLLSLASCDNQPKKLSGIPETIEVSYINWACDCANFIETKFYTPNSNETDLAKNCIFLEPSNEKCKIPEEFYSKTHFRYDLKVKGQFYTDKGVPNSYENKTPVTPDKARVFRYESFKLLKK